ncbi:hypothetical protein Tco_1302386 [Tanacetum coccineum]
MLVFSWSFGSIRFGNNQENRRGKHKYTFPASSQAFDPVERNKGKWLISVASFLLAIILCITLHPVTSLGGTNALSSLVTTVIPSFLWDNTVSASSMACFRDYEPLSKSSLSSLLKSWNYDRQLLLFAKNGIRDEVES